MLRHLAGGRLDNTYERRLALYARADLLVIDDFGLKPMQPPAAQDLYDVINERYERGSILLTSNRAPAEWSAWFADPLLASAGLDRLSHRAHVLVITGASYRAKDRLALGEKRGCPGLAIARRPVGSPARRRGRLGRGYPRPNLPRPLLHHRERATLGHQIFHTPLCQFLPAWRLTTGESVRRGRPNQLRRGLTARSDVSALKYFWQLLPKCCE